MEIRAEPDFEARRFEMGFRNLLLSDGRHSASGHHDVLGGVAAKIHGHDRRYARTRRIDLEWRIRSNGL